MELRRRAGLGLRQPHYKEVLDTENPPDCAFLEVHSENFFHLGGPSRAILNKARERYPISLHGVGLSLGSADTLNFAHLDKLCGLVEDIEPALVSEHLSWGAIDGLHLNDLLPLPYTQEALTLLQSRVHQVQDRLKRPILLENLSAYLQFQSSEMSEFAFLGELSRTTGCGILLDVNNLYVNSRNFDFNPLTEIEHLPAEAIGELHLAGHTVTATGLLDTHSTHVAESVWALYREVLARIGPRPTLIEWDADIPALAVLLQEQERANTILADLAHEPV